MTQIVAETVWIANSEEETRQLARKLAGLAESGTVIALDGELGAGKTAFSKAFAESLGVTGNVNSPTFTIIKEYEGARLPFYHMDVYRISLEEADELGLDDYFFGKGVTIVEWASLIEELLPQNRLELYIHYIDENKRQIALKAYGAPYTDWCLAVQRMGERNDDTNR